MGKIYTALGLMSGTSMDGVDASIIQSDGYSKFVNILDKYNKFDNKLYKKLVDLRNRIASKSDLKVFSEDLNNLERELTIFHSEFVKKIVDEYNGEINFVGFHGQTIFHDPKNKTTKQLGDGKLLSQLIKLPVVYDFRQNDLLNGGQGAPLTPIFHNLVANIILNENPDKFSNILNIGGISNITKTTKKVDFLEKEIQAFDVGPGNCLIDEWMRKNSNQKFDKGGQVGKSGKINKLILDQAIENFGIETYTRSFDIKDFDISFAKGLSLEDGCATITNYTAYLISEGIKYLDNKNEYISKRYLVCGGGRKNKFLLETINKYLKRFENIIIEPIDLYNFDGDFIESQAFGYLAIRSFLGLPISFSGTTGCNNNLGCQGGMLVNNF